MARYINQDTYTDYPESASNNAKRALEWRDENDNPNKCGTRVGWARANQLANKEPISAQTVKRMASFNRHRQNKDVPYSEGCGGLMWDAWGGTSGIDWAINKSKEIDNMVKINLVGEVVDSMWQKFYDEDDQIITDKIVEEAIAEVMDEDEVEFSISSPGGSVEAGMRIAAMIEGMPQKTTAILNGLVASIATPITLAADKVLARNNSMMMIHNASTFTWGDKNQMRKDANTLEQIDEQLIDAYIARIEKNEKLVDGDEVKTRKMLKKMMDEETWIPAKKALELGLVDAMCDDKEEEDKPKMFAMNSNNKKILASFSNLPNEIRAQVQPRKKGIFASILNFFTPKQEEPKEEKQEEPTNSNQSENQDEEMNKELLARLEALESKMTESAEAAQAKLDAQAKAHEDKIKALEEKQASEIEAMKQEKEALQAKLDEANEKRETSAPKFPSNNNNEGDKLTLTAEENKIFSAFGAAIKAKL